MFALLFMLFTTIIAPLIPTLSSQPPPPFPTFPSLTQPPPPPVPAFEFPPIPHFPPFPPFTPSLPDDNIWPPPSQPQPESMQFVLGCILTLTISISLIAVTIYICRRRGPPGPQGEKGETGPRGLHWYECPRLPEKVPPWELLFNSYMLLGPSKEKLLGPRSG
nr:hypothetical protein CFP56_56357 [Quercus suber]